MPTVSVSASVEREVPPDRYALTARASGDGADARTATAALVDVYRDLEAIAAALPSDAEVRHGPLSSWPANARRTRWTANRVMTVSGTDMDTLGAVADALAAVRGVSIDGPHWSIDRHNPAYAHLQAEAVHEAQERATRYAAALGGELGRLVELRDPNAAGHGYAHAMEASMQLRRAPEISAIDLTPQPLSISATVDATWYLVLGT